MKRETLKKIKKLKSKGDTTIKQIEPLVKLH